MVIHVSFFFVVVVVGLWICLNKLKVGAVNMSFALVSHYLPSTGHSAKKKRGKKTNKQKKVHPRRWRFVCSGRRKQIWKVPKQGCFEGEKNENKKARQNQPRFLCPVGRSEFDAEGALLNFLIVV